MRKGHLYSVIESIIYSKALDVTYIMYNNGCDNMSFSLKFERIIEFDTYRLARSESDPRPNYKHYPMERGVYIFHVSKIESIFNQAHNILYIGAANSSGIKGRIGINTRGKIKPHCQKKGISLCSVFVSFCVIGENETSSLHYLIERLLLHEYQKKYTDLPACNKI